MLDWRPGAPDACIEWGQWLSRWDQRAGQRGAVPSGPRRKGGLQSQPPGRKASGGARPRRGRRPPILCKTKHPQGWWWFVHFLERKQRPGGKDQAPELVLQPSFSEGLCHFLICGSRTQERITQKVASWSMLVWPLRSKAR